MDKLKEILAKKKPQEKLVSRKQVLTKERENYMAQLEQGKKKKQEEDNKRRIQGHKTKVSQLEPEPPMQSQEVKKKLRQLYQPVTMFGETNHRRYARYLKAKQFHQSNPNEDMKMYDEEFAKKIKQNQEFEELDARYRPQMIEPKLLDNIIFREKKMNQILKEKERNFEQMCDEVYLWIRKVLNSWGQALDHNSNDKKHLEQIRRKFELFMQTQSELSSFQRVLKAHRGDKQMILSAYNIMNCCLVREYVQANDKYIELSVGNAPWPMGEAMLGITVKKNSQKLSHVLDQQMTRRWMQGIKRIITVSQQLYPNQQAVKMAMFTVNKMT